jgi:hypothetical protein
MFTLYFENLLFYSWNLVNFCHFLRTYLHHKVPHILIIRVACHLQWFERVLINYFILFFLFGENDIDCEFECIIYSMIVPSILGSSIFNSWLDSSRHGLVLISMSHMLNSSSTIKSYPNISKQCFL